MAFLCLFTCFSPGRGSETLRARLIPPGEHGKEAQCPVCEPVTGRAGTTGEDGESAACQVLGSHLDSCCVCCSWSGSGSPRKVAEARGPTARRGAVGAGIRLLSPVGNTEGCKLSTEISEWGQDSKVRCVGRLPEGALGWSGGEGELWP